MAALVAVRWLGRGLAMNSENDVRDAYPFREWCRRNGIGVTTGYAEVKAGRLIARKVRGRTIITREDAKAGRESLPKLQTAVVA
jgi:predicted site-specific integrase-resolvase